MELGSISLAVRTLGGSYPEFDVQMIAPSGFSAA